MQESVQSLKHGFSKRWICACEAHQLSLRHWSLHISTMQWKTPRSTRHQDGTKGNDRASQTWGYLCVDELDDVWLAAQALQQPDLIDEAAGSFSIPSGQPDALQCKDLAVGRHHLCGQPAGDESSLGMHITRHARSTLRLPEEHAYFLSCCNFAATGVGACRPAVTMAACCLRIRSGTLQDVESDHSGASDRNQKAMYRV